jgi:hypothetical protein
MRRSSGRGQAEPLAALAAVLAVAAGLVIYAGTLDDRLPGRHDRQIAETTLDRVERALQTTGVVDPERLGTALSRLPDGWHGNLTLRANGRRWSRGPAPPTDAERATGRVSVGVAPTRICPGQLRVVVWQ